MNGQYLLNSLYLVLAIVNSARARSDIFLFEIIGKSNLYITEKKSFISRVPVSLIDLKFTVRLSSTELVVGYSKYI